MKLAVEKYKEIPPSWSRVINAATDKGLLLEELVFVKQADGTIKPFDTPLSSIEKKPGHCVVVLSISSVDGYSARITYVTPFRRAVKNSSPG